MVPSALAFILVALFGGFVGLSELVSRYRDSPMGAILTMPGLLYIAINGAAAAAALFLLAINEVFPAANWTDFNKDAVLALLTAGFGAMVFFRSAVFNVRVGDKEWGVGPATLLQVVMDAADRACDRSRAMPRSNSVNDIMRGVSFEHASAALPAYCFGLMQNVRPDEQKAFANLVSDLGKSQMSEGFKTLNLGLGLMNIVGENVLRAAVSALGGKIRGPISAQLTTIMTLKGLEFERDHAALILACRTLTSDRKQRSVLGDWLKKTDPVTDVAQAIKKEAGLDNDNKVLLLATELLDRYGEAVLVASANAVKNSQPPAAPNVVAPPKTAATLVTQGGAAPAPAAE